MNLWDTASKAFDAAVRQFFNQRTDAHLYIYPLKLGKATFFTVLTASQVAKYKIPKLKAYWVVGDNETILSHKRAIQQARPDEREMALHKALRTYYRAKGKLDKLIAKTPELLKEKGEAGAESGKTPT